MWVCLKWNIIYIADTNKEFSKTLHKSRETETERQKQR